MQQVGQYLQSETPKSGFGQFNVINEGALQARLSDLGGLIVSKALKSCLLAPEYYSPMPRYLPMLTLPTFEPTFNFSATNFWFL